MFIMTMSSKLSLNLLRCGLVLCFALPCAPQAVSQSAPPGAPGPLLETYPDLYDGRLSPWQKELARPVLPFLQEVKGIKIEEFTVNEAPLQEALDKLWKIILSNQPYLKELSLEPSTKLQLVTLSTKDIELGELILKLADFSNCSSVKENEGKVTFSREFPEIQWTTIRIKAETAKKLGLPQVPPGGKHRVKEILSKWAIKPAQADYLPMKRWLFLESSEETLQHLRSLIYFMESGVEINLSK